MMNQHFAKQDKSTLLYILTKGKDYNSSLISSTQSKSSQPDLNLTTKLRVYLFPPLDSNPYKMPTYNKENFQNNSSKILETKPYPGTSPEYLQTCYLPFFYGQTPQCEQILKFVVLAKSRNGQTFFPFGQATMEAKKLNLAFKQEQRRIPLIKCRRQDDNSQQQNIYKLNSGQLQISYAKIKPSFRKSQISMKIQLQINQKQLPEKPFYLICSNDSNACKIHIRISRIQVKSQNQVDNQIYISQQVYLPFRQDLKKNKKPKPTKPTQRENFFSVLYNEVFIKEFKFYHNSDGEFKISIHQSSNMIVDSKKFTLKEQLYKLRKLNKQKQKARLQVPAAPLMPPAPAYGHPPSLQWEQQQQQKTNEQIPDGSGNQKKKQRSIGPTASSSIPNINQIINNTSFNSNPKNVNIQEIAGKQIKMDIDETKNEYKVGGNYKSEMNFSEQNEKTKEKNVKKKQSQEKYQIIIKDIKRICKNNFYQYLQSGLEIQTYIALDFCSSNSNRHKIPPEQNNTNQRYQISSTVNPFLQILKRLIPLACQLSHQNCTKILGYNAYQQSQSQSIFLIPLSNSPSFRSPLSVPLSPYQNFQKQYKSILLGKLLKISAYAEMRKIIKYIVEQCQRDRENLDKIKKSKIADGIGEDQHEHSKENEQFQNGIKYRVLFLINDGSINSKIDGEGQRCRKKIIEAVSNYLGFTIISINISNFTPNKMLEQQNLAMIHKQRSSVDTFRLSKLLSHVQPVLPRNNNEAFDISYHIKANEKPDLNHTCPRPVFEYLDYGEIFNQETKKNDKKMEENPGQRKIEKKKHFVKEINRIVRQHVESYFKLRESINK